MGDRVCLVACKAVGDVDVLAVTRDDDLASRGGGGIGRREGRTVRADLLGSSEGDGGTVVRDGEDFERVGQLAGDDVSRGLVTLGRVPGAVTGTAASSADAVARRDLIGIILGVNDNNAVGAEVADGEETARGIENGLVCARLVLTSLVGTESSTQSDLLQELERARLRDIPDVYSALATGEGD